MYILCMYKWTLPCREYIYNVWCYCDFPRFFLSDVFRLTLHVHGRNLLKIEKSKPIGPDGAEIFKTHSTQQYIELNFLSGMRVVLYHFSLEIDFIGCEAVQFSIAYVRLWSNHRSLISQMRYEFGWITIFLSLLIMWSCVPRHHQWQQQLFTYHLISFWGFFYSIFISHTKRTLARTHTWADSKRWRWVWGRESMLAYIGWIQLIIHACACGVHCSGS